MHPPSSAPASAPAPAHPPTTLTDIISPLMAGNPGALNVMMAVLHASPEAGGQFLADLTRSELKGSDIWLLNQFVGTPPRAAALLHSCLYLGLPDLPQLRRDLAVCERNRHHHPDPVVEMAISVLGERLPMFAGLNLTRPEEWP